MITPRITFIKDLVDLRKSQDISLEDVYERTKISISSLQSIEKGNFNDLPEVSMNVPPRLPRNLMLKTTSLTS